MYYPKYLRYLDLFGFSGSMSALTYVLLPVGFRPDDHLDSLWGNLSTEMMGIWIGVRFIDLIIRSHESFTKARVRIVRNMRFVERGFHQLIEFRRPIELKNFYREYHWIHDRLGKRFKHLKKDERMDVLRFFGKADEMLAHIPPLESHLQDKFEIEEIDVYFERLSQLENLRIIAEENILEETDEDDGF